MNLLTKFKETAISVFPVMVIVLILGLFIVPIEKTLLCGFFVSGILLTLGLTIFLLGVDLGIQPMGERTGAALTNKKNLFLLLSCAFVIGFIVTAAEPDIQVFASQVKNQFPGISKPIFTFAIATGVGLFITIGLLKTVLNWSLKWTLFIFYVILFAILVFVSDNFVGISFDSGGATTGPMTVPFIMALGLGVSSVRATNDNKNSFGLTGVTSLGPVIAVLIYSFFVNKNMNTEGISTFQATTVSQVSFPAKIFLPFAQCFVHVLHESLISILPLFILFIVFQIFLLKMTKRQVIRMAIGFFYSFTGLLLFLTGVNGGFMQAGEILGKTLGEMVAKNGGVWYFILITTGLLLGAIIVCAEPAVWVLSEQVETVSGGTIKRKVLLVFLSFGTAIAIGLSLWRSILGINLRFILIPGYVIAFVLMIFCPDLFTGIAFDSGGVASGPLTSTFVLSFTIGAANGCGKTNDSFGVISLVALMPLIAIQIMGIIFKLKTKTRG